MGERIPGRSKLSEDIANAANTVVTVDEAGIAALYRSAL